MDVNHLVNIWLFGSYSEEGLIRPEVIIEDILSENFPGPHEFASGLSSLSAKNIGVVLYKSLTEKQLTRIRLKIMADGFLCFVQERNERAYEFGYEIEDPILWFNPHGHHTPTKRTPGPEPIDYESERYPNYSTWFAAIGQAVRHSKWWKVNGSLVKKSYKSLKMMEDIQKE